MKDKSMEWARVTDLHYFGPATLQRSVSLLENHIISMLERPDRANIQKQAGDLLFGLVSMCRNQDWNMDALLAEATQRVILRREHTAYYEARLWVISPRGKGDDVLVTLCRQYGFHVDEAEDRCIGRSGSFTDVQDRMLALYTVLKQNHFAIERYWITTVVLDSQRDRVILNDIQPKVTDEPAAQPTGDAQPNGTEETVDGGVLAEDPTGSR